MKPTRNDRCITKMPYLRINYNGVILKVIEGGTFISLTAPLTAPYLPPVQGASQMHDG